MQTPAHPWNRYRTETAALQIRPPDEGQTDTRESCAHGDDVLPILIIGAGLAGSWLAASLARRGLPVTLLDAGSEAASGASGNPAGIFKPQVSRAPSDAMDFHVEAAALLQARLNSWFDDSRHDGGEPLFHRCGVLQLVNRAFPDSPAYRSLDPRRTRTEAGTETHAPSLLFEHGGWLNPAHLCQRLLEHPNIRLITRRHVIDHTLMATDAKAACWRVRCEDGSEFHSTRLVLANGYRMTRFAEAAHLPIIPARGQMSRFALASDARAPRCIITGKHYVIPQHDSLIVGASFLRDEVDTDVRDSEHAENLAGLQQLLPELSVNPHAIDGRAGIRATTPDRLPIAGPAPNCQHVARQYAELRHGRLPEDRPALPCHRGLYLLGGLGSRGIVTAPLAAECLAERLLRDDDSDARHDSAERWTELLNPARFLLRNLRRGRCHSIESIPTG